MTSAIVARVCATAASAAPGPNAIVGYDWPVPTAMPPAAELAARFDIVLGWTPKA